MLSLMSKTDSGTPNINQAATPNHKLEDDPPASEASREVANLTERKNPHTPVYVTDVSDRAFACLKSVLRIGVDKDHRASNWVLILYQTCTLFF